MQHNTNNDLKIKRVISLLNNEQLILRARKKEDGTVSQLDSFLMYDAKEAEQLIQLLHELSGATEKLVFIEPSKTTKDSYRIVVQLDLISDEMLDSMEKLKQKTLVKVCHFLNVLDCYSTSGKWTVDSKGICFMPHDSDEIHSFSAIELKECITTALAPFVLSNQKVNGRDILSQSDLDLYEQYVQQSLTSNFSFISYLPLASIGMILINLAIHFPQNTNKQLTENDAIDYGKQLGRGEYAVVKAGSYNGKPIALKISTADHASSYHSLYRESIMYAWLETAKKNSSNHPGANYIAQYLGYRDQGLQHGFVLAIELIHGNLKSLIFSDTGKNIAVQVLSAKEAKAIFYGIAAGLSFIHQHDLVYCDIKLENILYLQDEQGIHIKFIDFGLSKHKHSSCAEVKGSPVYEAPETFKRCQQDAKSDVYGMGITFWEVTARRPIYESNPKIGTLLHLERYVLSGERPAIVNATPEVSAIIQQCWAHDANNRPTAEQCREQIEQLDEHQCWAQPNTLN